MRLLGEALDWLKMPVDEWECGYAKWLCEELRDEPLCTSLGRVMRIGTTLRAMGKRFVGMGYGRHKGHLRTSGQTKRQTKR